MGIISIQDLSTNELEELHQQIVYELNMRHLEQLREYQRQKEADHAGMDS